MKTKFKFIAASLAALIATSGAYAGVLAEFGSSASNPFSIEPSVTIGFGTLEQSTSSINYAGSENLGNQWGGFWSTPWTLSANDQTSLSIALLDNAALTGNITVTLFSPDFSQQKTFEAFLSSVTTTQTVLNLAFVSQTASFTNVGGFTIAFNGNSGTAFTASAFNLSSTSAIPEPSTAAALGGLAILGFAAARRQRRSV